MESIQFDELRAWGAISSKENVAPTCTCSRGNSKTAVFAHISTHLHNLIFFQPSQSVGLDDAQGLFCRCFHFTSPLPAAVQFNSPGPVDTRSNWSSRAASGWLRALHERVGENAHSYVRHVSGLEGSGKTLTTQGHPEDPMMHGRG